MVIKIEVFFFIIGYMIPNNLDSQYSNNEEIISENVYKLVAYKKSISLIC